MSDPHQGGAPAAVATLGAGARSRLIVRLVGGVLPGLAAVLLVVAPVGAVTIEWSPPVDAPVIDPFRPPSERWGPGNRGLEYGLDREVEIRAVDAGRVRFAGRVAGSAHVTIDHGGGLWSTSAYLDSVAVVRGQRIERGQVLGTAGPGFHLTARLDGEYVDPALFLAGAEIGVRLVAGPSPPSLRDRGAAGEPSRTPDPNRPRRLLAGMLMA